MTLVFAQAFCSSVFIAQDGLFVHRNTTSRLPDDPLEDGKE